MRHDRGNFSLLLLTGLATFAACSTEKGPRKITQNRETEVGPGSEKVGATSAERFGDSRGATAENAHSHSSSGELVWDNPPGWKELPPTEMRYANLQPAGHPDAECFLSVLPGRDDAVAANVNRWRGQFGLEPLEDAAIAALPTQSLLKLDATRVEMEGAYAGMSGGEGRPGFMLIGLIAPFADRLITVKMVAPTEVVAAERERFDAFVASLAIREGGKSATQEPSNAAPASTTQPAPVEQPAAVPPANGKEAQGELKFTAPTDWTRDPERPMRLATLRPPETKLTECVITVLAGGGGGGFASNLDRWRGQMGLPPSTEEERAALPKLAMAGVEGVLIDMVGAFQDAMTQRSIANARLLGAIAIVGDKGVFVKLTGPETEVDDRVRDGFRQLCASLTW